MSTTTLNDIWITSRGSYVYKAIREWRYKTCRHILSLRADKRIPMKIVPRKLLFHGYNHRSVDCRLFRLLACWLGHDTGATVTVCTSHPGCMRDSPTWGNWTNRVRCDLSVYWGVHSGCTNGQYRLTEISRLQRLFSIVPLTWAWIT